MGRQNWPKDCKASWHGIKNNRSREITMRLGQQDRKREWTLKLPSNLPKCANGHMPILMNASYTFTHPITVFFKKQNYQRDTDSINLGPLSKIWMLIKYVWMLHISLTSTLIQLSLFTFCNELNEMWLQLGWEENIIFQMECVWST